jgi:hypothetical protein
MGRTRPGVAQAYSSITMSVCRSRSRSLDAADLPASVEAMPNDGALPFDADPASPFLRNRGVHSSPPAALKSAFAPSSP